MFLLITVSPVTTRFYTVYVLSSYTSHIIESINPPQPETNVISSCVNYNFTTETDPVTVNITTSPLYATTTDSALPSGPPGSERNINPITLTVGIVLFLVAAAIVVNALILTLVFYMSRKKSKSRSEAGLSIATFRVPLSQHSNVDEPRYVEMHQVKES